MEVGDQRVETQDEVNSSLLFGIGVIAFHERYPMFYIADTEGDGGVLYGQMVKSSNVVLHNL